MPFRERAIVLVIALFFWLRRNRGGIPVFTCEGFNGMFLPSLFSWKGDAMRLFSNYFGNEVKIQLVRESKPVKEYSIKTPDDAYELVKDELATLDREAFLVISLSTKNKVLGVNMVSIGSLNANVVHPRDVFKLAILQNASNIILLHNHPSGETEPSKDDIEVTHRLEEAGKLLGIEVIDHIVVGNTFYSFMENDLLKEK